ncbi:MAG TPA: hypothetical protein DCL48_08995 [Alphaproteobacteria bacterium]|nr:hypothetical protein [Alphaproteobacteria bacterium]
MVSTATSRLRFNKQGVGDNVNTWGTTLNGQVFDLADEAIAGVETIALTGNKTLTATNYVSDEARNMALRFTGSLSSGATITIPSAEKLYFIINDSGATLTFSAGGTTGDVENGRRKWIACNGTDVYVGEDGADKEYVDTALNLKLNLAGGTMTGKIILDGDGSAALHPVTKQQLDAAALSATLGYPALSANALKVLRVNAGETAIEWASPSVAWANVSGTPTTLAGYGITDAQPLDADLTALAGLSTTAAGREQLILNRRNVAFADSPVTAAYGDDISCNSSGGAITINLPPAVAGRAPIIIRAGASAATNNVTVEPDGAETILGETNLQIDINHFSASFAAKAGAWV